jgi:hypothetical protein
MISNGRQNSEWSGQLKMKLKQFVGDGHLTLDMSIWALIKDFLLIHLLPATLCLWQVR